MSRHKLYSIIGLLSFSAAVIACELITLPPPPTPVTVNWGQTAKQAIGNALQSMYGDNFNSQEVFMNVAIRTPIGGAAIVPFTKPCNESFEEAGESGGGMAGGGAGGNDPPGGGGGYGGGGGCVGSCGGGNGGGGGTVIVGDPFPVPTNPT